VRETVATTTEKRIPLSFDYCIVAEMIEDSLAAISIDMTSASMSTTQSSSGVVTVAPEG
jgi:hypothetical protein